MAPAQPMTPTPEQVKQVREAVQASMSIGITAAQDWCANALHTSRRSFQQWETGARAIHPAFWELLTIKTALIAHKSKNP
jgi:DNA-binding transcriptional regulator YiaG